MLFINFTLTFISQVISFLSSAASAVIISRVCGAAAQGTMSLLANFANILVALLILGLNWSNTYWVAKSKELKNAIFSNSLVFSFILLTVVVILYFSGALSFFGRFFLGASFLKLALFAVPFMIFIQLNQSILLGMQKLTPYNMVTILRNSLLAAFLFIFLFIFKKPFIFAVWLWFIANICLCLFSGFLMRKHLNGGILLPDLAVFRGSVKTGLRVFLLSAISLLTMRIDLFLIKYFKGDESVGYYSVAVLLAEVLLFVPQILGQLILPKGSSQEAGSLALALQVNRIIVIYSISSALFIALFIHPVLLFAFGAKFLFSMASALLLLPGIIALNIVSTISYYICGRDGYPLEIVLAGFISLLANILLNIMLIPRFGISGAAISSTLAYTLNTALNLRFFVAFKNIKVADLLLFKRKDMGAITAKLNFLGL